LKAVILSEAARQRCAVEGSAFAFAFAFLSVIPEGNLLVRSSAKLIGMKIGAFLLLLFAATTFEARLYAQQIPAWSSEVETPEGHLKRIERRAEEGDKKAAYELGQMCAFGFPAKPDDLYRPRDLQQALHWFEIGAETPYEKSQVALMYANGNPFPKNPEAAEHWYRSTGEPLYVFEAGETYKAAAEADPSQASKYYPKATAIFLELLNDDSNRRRAQLELGNFVIDGIYSAGDNAAGRAQNLALARMIAQELLGQKLYQIAVEYDIGEEDLPKDQSMWLRYVKRAAAYNIDLAQHFYVEAMGNNKAPDLSGYDYIAWTRIENDSNRRNEKLLNALTSGMSPQQLQAADAPYRALQQRREKDGAFYTADDPLANPSLEALNAMDQDDPDVQLRRAFSMESAAARDKEAYERAISLYRDVRDHRDTAPRFVLGRYALTGANGVPKDRGVALYWLHEAARSGSSPAQTLLQSIEK
jgi:TPR repeat protein